MVRLFYVISINSVTSPWNRGSYMSAHVLLLNESGKRKDAKLYRSVFPNEFNTLNDTVQRMQDFFLSDDTKMTFN